MSKTRDRILMIRHYKEATGANEIDMHDVARFAKEQGWPLPEPADPLDLLARSFSRAARQDIRRDSETGQPYRGYHAYKLSQGSDQLVFWVDIDEASRKQMHMSATQRREQMVGDGLQLTLDIEHWNQINEEDAPIPVDLDLTDDIEWRKNAPSEEED